MTRLWSTGEVVRVVANGQNHPQQFVWQGRAHGVEAIQQMWEVDTDWWSEEGRIWRADFALTTDRGLLCVLFHDRLHSEWRLAKVYD